MRRRGKIREERMRVGLEDLRGKEGEVVKFMLHYASFILSVCTFFFQTIVNNNTTIKGPSRGTHRGPL